MNALSKHSRELIALRRGDHSAARLRMEQVRFQREQKAQEELGRLEWKQLLAAEFEKWIQKPEILKLIQEGRTGDADIIYAIRLRVYGAAARLLTPQEHRETPLNLAMDGDGI